MKLDFNGLRDNLQWLRGEDGVVPDSEAIDVLARLLAPLLAAEGLDLHSPESPGLGVDLLASRASGPDTQRVSVAIEYVHHGHGRPIDVDKVRELVSHTGLTPYERAMLIGRFGFTSAARTEAARVEPVTVELLDLDGIDAWIRRLEVGRPDKADRIELMIRSLSHGFAECVAEDPAYLDRLEWRDLERMMARVMEGLGFDTVLTPGSKDGGKDLILTCRVSNNEESYIVELKHWRSGKRVGPRPVADFLSVVIDEDRAGGLFLSTSGYSANKFEGLTEVTRQRLRLGERNKVVLLAQTYVRACQGLWSPPASLPEVLFEGTA